MMCLFVSILTVDTIYVRADNKMVLLIFVCRNNIADHEFDFIFDFRFSFAVSYFIFFVSFNKINFNRLRSAYYLTIGASMNRIHLNRKCIKYVYIRNLNIYYIESIFLTPAQDGLMRDQTNCDQLNINFVIISECRSAFGSP